MILKDLDTEELDIEKQPETPETSKIKRAAARFAAEFSLYKLVWVFFAAGVLGYVIETAFCFIKLGVFESRQGLLYGPFSQVYGFGAVVMVLVLTPLSKKGGGWLFFGSALVGGVFEYMCSLIQEITVGTVSWEYSKLSLSIGGRTSLTYMFFWGILGLGFIKFIYPWLSGLIDRIPRRPGLFLAWVLMIAITVDMTLSGMAIYRWTERQHGTAPANAYDEFLDRHYTNGTLEKIYPNMKTVNKE